MSFSHNIASFLIILISLLTSHTSRALEFAPNSVLGSGKWIKIQIGETGIYEIPYDALRQMGFQNPEKVGVYGKGGSPVPSSFTDGSNRLYHDDLRPVGVLHQNDRIYFYGVSVEKIELETSSLQFERKGKNIYTDKGIYFLSENDTPLQIDVEAAPSGQVKIYSLGYDFVYYEKDLHQNTTGTGQLFWGESLLENAMGLKWHHHLPLLNNSGKVRLECKVYAADKSKGTLKYGVEEAISGNKTFTVRHPSPASGTKENPEFIPMTNPISSLSVPGKDATVFMQVSNGDGNFINLDYWILSYSKQIPDFTLTESSQERLSIPISGTRPGMIQGKDNDSVVVFDVTDPESVSALYSRRENNLINYYFKTEGEYRDFIFADLSRPQLSISGYEEVDNSDIHSLAAEGADFIIITTPRYMDFSNQLADLHRIHNGMKVIVANSEEVYNEFSGGMPDPMAYRALAKMAYDSNPGRLKNMLLVGKFFGDFRRTADNPGSKDFLIAFQDNRVSMTTDASNVMDYYGMLDDYTYNSLQNNKVEVGIGILPFHNTQDADRYLQKVEKYLNDTDKALYINEMMSMGGAGDSHTHDGQAIQLSEELDRLAPQKMVNVQLPFDAYGEKGSKDAITTELEYGKLISTFTGHGNMIGLDAAYDIFKSGDIGRLKNDKTGFMLIFACDMSETDFARKGFGEQIVTSTRNGMLGSVIATRTVWSGQNFELAKLLNTSFFTDLSDNIMEGGNLRKYYRQSSPTLGEVYAQAKSQSNYLNSLTYILIGDPALSVPVPLRRISVDLPHSVAPATPFHISGTILGRDSIHLQENSPVETNALAKDEGFNGKIVVKIMTPESKIVSGDFLTNCGVTLDMKAPTGRIIEFQTTVENGEFELDAILPKEVSIYNGKDLQVYVSAYDFDRDLGAAGYSIFNANIADLSEEDTTPPSISCQTDAATSDLMIHLSDDHAISKQGVRAYVGNVLIPILSRDGAASESGKTLDLIVPMSNFKDGKYTVKIEAADIAGNSNVREEMITVAHRRAAIFLHTDRKVAEEEIVFTQSCDHPLSSPLLTITDPTGTTVASIPMNDREFTLNISDLKGAGKNSGLFKAKLEGFGNGGIPLCSDWVSFVIR
ncbi:MAG: hypothetical protein K2N05_08720 [Muribaculaceae bacterium]|nr:hypothetical protein [Muribaculaceae bacterium]